MDCKTARYLLDFARPRGHDLDGADRAALDAHLAVCTDCDSAARAERHFDDHLGRAVRDVPVPHGFKDRLLGKLRQQRDDWWKQVMGRGMRYAAAAAAILVVCIVGLWYYQSRKVPLNSDLVIENVKARYVTPSTRADADEWFKKRGKTVEAPTDFEYAYLSSYDLTNFYGEVVPHLLFVRPSSPGQTTSVHVAQVFILSDNDWDIRELPARLDDPSGDQYKVTIRKPAGRKHAYAILYTGDLKSFLTRADAESE